MVKSLKSSLWLVALSLLPFASSCALPKFEPTYGSSRRAILQGEIKEAFAAYESQAIEAEKKAAASWFPQQYWEAASLNYREASRVATWTGQLQKAIFFGEKSLEMAMKAKKPSLRLVAAYGLIDAYRTVRNFAKVKELLEKGSQIVKEIPPNTDARISLEMLLYQRLGLDLMRRHEYEKAVDVFSQSVHLSREHLANLSRRRNPRESRIEDARDTAILGVVMLGSAYRQTGRFQEALGQYQDALNSIRESRLKLTREDELYRGIGEIYFRQNNFYQALENYRRALGLAESRARPAAVSLASRRIGDILRETGKPAEAVPYYQKAIQQIESTRSFLESEELRYSFFEGGLDAYVSMVDVLLAVGNTEDAFNYNERARSRVFLDILGSKVQLSRVKSGLLDEERALQERIAAIKARLAGEETETEREYLRRELREAERAYNGFLAKVRKQDKEQASLMTVEPLTLREVQELLDGGTTLIEYFVTQRNVFVWVVEKERIHFQRVELSREKLSNLVRALRESIFTLGERDKFNVASQSLYRDLIEPLLPHITGKELIILDDALFGPNEHRQT